MSNETRVVAVDGKVTDDDLAGIEEWMSNNWPKSTFFPVDANYLAGATMLMVREVRAARAMLSAAPAPNPSADGDAHDKCLAKYAELIYAVGNKYPGETRHETALRYIRQAENRDLGPAQQAIDRVQTENL